MNGIPPLSSRDAHASPPQRVLERLHSSAAGLDADEAARRLAAHGYNRLPAPKRQGPLLRLLRQFHNVLLYMMLFASLVTALLGFWVDSAVILLAVVVNALIGFVQEGKAANALDAIRDMLSLHGARGELGALSLSVEAENRAEANRFMESVLPTLWMLKDYALQSGAGLAFEHPVSKPVVLTSREKEVLQWCAIGKTSWEISVICNCSEANVNFHMGNIRRKFGVTSRRVAAIMAVNLGLITL